VGASGRALVLALDGATWDVIRPLAAAGRLPNLQALLGEGRDAPLPSTVPPMTFPAWSSFMTGLGPGRHGVFDFTQKLAGAYRVRFVHAGDRAGRSLFARVSAAGGRVLVLGMPACHPPEPVNGLLVSGFDAPVSTGTDPSRASDPALYREIAARAGPWMQPDLSESADEAAFHERARETLLARIARKTRFTLAALDALEARGGAPDLAVVVFAESDTVAHHYWRDHDPGSPRHDPDASAARKSAVVDVYAALDAACGEIRARFGEDAPCFVVSDHGAGGASRRVLHLNRHLADCGLLTRRRDATARLDGWARAARDGVVRALPPRLAQWAFRRARGAAARWESAVRFAGHDWSRTAAFSEETNTQPGVWINLRGREAEGSVAPGDYERVRTELVDALLAWRLPGPDGGPVVARARPREEVYEGPFVERAPDVVVELALEAGYAHSLVPTPWNAPGAVSVHTLSGEELAGARGRGMNGTHRPDGVWIASGVAGEAAEAAATVGSIVDAAPAVARAMGLAWDDEDAGSPGGESTPYTEEEEAQVAARLRALGYLE
jgi:predicted AlkP superfamily phosphohydrolase/phosphomutase